MPKAKTYISIQECGLVITYRHTETAVLILTHRSASEEEEYIHQAPTKVPRRDTRVAGEATVRRTL